MVGTLKSVRGTGEDRNEKSRYLPPILRVKKSVQHHSYVLHSDTDHVTTMYYSPPETVTPERISLGLNLFGQGGETLRCVVRRKTLVVTVPGEEDRLL